MFDATQPLPDRPPSTKPAPLIRETLARRCARATERERLDVGRPADHTRDFERALQRQIIGQDHAVEALTSVFSRVMSRLRDPTRPVLTLLLLGPTGVGKTETAKVLAKTLFGSEKALTRVGCEEYAHGHEMAKLLGAPPGYVGHCVEPLLSQRRLDEAHRRALLEHSGMLGENIGDIQQLFPQDEGQCLSLVLFDEIEKAHPVLWNALLGILEEGLLTLGNNETTELTRSIIVMTSNVGSREMSRRLERRRTLGFLAEHSERRKPDVDMTATATLAAREIFPLEFLNRFDEILVYQPLERDHLEQIFDKFLGEIHERALEQAGVPLLIRISREAQDLILDQGTDPAFGARPLRRAMERALVDPISRLIAALEITAGDVLEIERDGDELVFYRQQADSDELVL
ncbi:MAG: ATP-dependent Clp protease ATP-binding subunit [Acidobacteriota bacterium]|nr:MAG: ATP-dependent Clp protease ATP-binding subunit [Acidobacteriota bacterium]